MQPPPRSDPPLLCRPARPASCATALLFEKQPLFKMVSVTFLCRRCGGARSRRALSQGCVPPHPLCVAAPGLLCRGSLDRVAAEASRPRAERHVLETAGCERQWDDTVFLM